MNIEKFMLFVSLTFNLYKPPMPFRWHFFRVICTLQLLCALYFAMHYFAAFLNHGGFMRAVSLLVAILVGLFASLGIRLLSQNYPSLPVSGAQKKNFNRLYLINILIPAMLFAEVFAAYNLLKHLSLLSNTLWYQFPLRITYPLYLSAFSLMAQFYILYGLFVLRKELYVNHSKKQFEFENE